jgi:hypothetical protein
MCFWDHLYLLEVNGLFYRQCSILISQHHQVYRTCQRTPFGGNEPIQCLC